MTTALFELCKAVLESEREGLLERMRELEDALFRLATGTFGFCEVCADEIDEDRLARIPEARMCEDCAEARPFVITASTDVE